MDSVKERLSKLREERAAREKARIEKLRELNRKKYGEIGTSSIQSQSNMPLVNRPSSAPLNLVPKKNSIVKNNFHINRTYKEPTSGLAHLKKTHKIDLCSKSNVELKKINKVESNINESNIIKNVAQQTLHEAQGKTISTQMTHNTQQDVKTKTEVSKTDSSKIAETNRKSLKSFSSMQKKPTTVANLSKPTNSKKSIQPAKVTQDAGDGTSKRVSVFERLYKPKKVSVAQVDKAEKLKTDPKYLKMVIGNAEKITGRRHTMSQLKPAGLPVRRSISALHLRRANTNELRKCVHNWSSVGEKLDEVNIDEAEDEKLISAVKSEKKVKFLTPISNKYNTPSPVELQEKLKNWLENHGKSLNSYQHLQCFGINHLSKASAVEIPSKPELYDEENKENIALESDSDDLSYTENLNDRKNDFVEKNKQCFEEWRRASNGSDNTSLNESKNLTLTPSHDYNHVDKLVLGALNDLTELLREGFDWGQCACWLRAIHQRFPSTQNTAAYWECKAALAERRGDLPASMQCWGEAFAVGTERSVVEANVDQLLDKFMQLKISPSSGRQKQIDPKMVNVKNFVKSTVIRFAVQKAKLPKPASNTRKPYQDLSTPSPNHRRRSNPPEKKSYTVTPVRRSVRLSTHSSTKPTSLQICTTLTQASTLGHPLVFVPNNCLLGTP